MISVKISTCQAVNAEAAVVCALANVHVGKRILVTQTAHRAEHCARNVAAVGVPKRNSFGAVGIKIKRATLELFVCELARHNFNVDFCAVLLLKCHPFCHVLGLPIRAAKLVARVFDGSTFRILARVWAKRVLPEPVGPMSRMLLF